MARVRARKETHRRRGRVFRASWATGGFGMIALGVVLIPLPGPGWLVVALGLGMLALEFDRAERLLDRILEQLERVTEQAVAGSRLGVAALVLGVVAVVAALVAVGVLWDFPLGPFS
jgi:uncharacterized protein (TIGR02611 family)